MMGDAAFAAYQTYMKESNVVVTDKHQFVGGAVGYKVLVGNREVVVVNERFVPENEAWGLIPPPSRWRAPAGILPLRIQASLH